MPLNSETVLKGLETLQRILNFGINTTGLDISILTKILNILHNKSFNPMIVQIGLKLIEILSRDQVLIKQLQEKDGLNSLVKLMEKHPFERNILTLGAKILSRLATIEDLKSVMQKIKENGKKYKY